MKLGCNPSLGSPRDWESMACCETQQLREKPRNWYQVSYLNIFPRFPETLCAMDHFQFRSFGYFGKSQLVELLQAQPEFRLYTEAAFQASGGIEGYALPWLVVSEGRVGGIFMAAAAPVFVRLRAVSSLDDL